MVRAAKWRADNRAPLGCSCERVNHRYLDCFFQRKLRQKRGGRSREHRFASSRRTIKRDVVPACHSNFQSAFGAILFSYIVKNRPFNLAIFCPVEIFFLYEWLYWLLSIQMPYQFFEIAYA